MNKMFVFLLFALQLAFAFTPFHEEADCHCPSVANVQKTGSGSGSASWSWTGSLSATSYEVWYTRRSDGYTSQPVTVTATNTAFSGLSGGAHTFYFKSLCDGGESQLIGVEDIIEN
ncbi:MAG: hypothetical protein H6577_09340 [Lewinellaceae bacterium]|nr:hypothetical protein [Saprospiraceae bacterium]MCB9338319.1 hypothetical protein [Lewinellaceae bacterium]